VLFATAYVQEGIDEAVTTPNGVGFGIAAIATSNGTGFGIAATFETSASPPSQPLNGVGFRSAAIATPNGVGFGQ
jgi:hypothetical protein